MENNLEYSEEIFEGKSYIEGEKFFYSIPKDLLNKNLSSKSFVHNLLYWDPWPIELNTERRIGNYVVKAIQANATNINKKYRIALIKKHDEKVWKEWGGDVEANRWYYSFRKQSKNTFVGKQMIIQDVFARTAKAIPGTVEYEKDYNMFVLSFTPSIEHIKTVFKDRDKIRCFTRLDHNFSENEKEKREVCLNFEWYRKILVKHKKQLKNNIRKMLAKEKGMTLKEFSVFEKSQKHKLKNATRTIEWVKIAHDVKKSKEFLDKISKLMAQNEEFKREWLFDNVESLRVLTRKLSNFNKCIKV